MLRAGASRNPTERDNRALRGRFNPVYRICYCSLSLFLFSLMYLRAFLLFNIKASIKEIEKQEEMTKQVYGGKQHPEIPEFPFPLRLPAPVAALR